MTATTNPVNRITVLLVDDDADILESVGQIFQFFMPGYQLLVAPSAAQALAILQRRPVDILVSDYRMPGMDGVTFLTKARENWPNIPRFLFTAYPDQEIIDRARKQADIRGIIAKPCDVDSFLAAFDGLIRPMAH